MALLLLILLLTVSCGFFDLFTSTAEDVHSTVHETIEVAKETKLAVQKVNSILGIVLQWLPTFLVGLVAGDQSRRRNKWKKKVNGNEQAKNNKN